MRFTVIAFVQSKSLGASAALANSDAIDGCQQLCDVVTIGFAQREIQRMTIGVNDEVPFQAFDTVFS